MKTGARSTYSSTVLQTESNFHSAKNSLPPVHCFPICDILEQTSLGILFKMKILWPLPDSLNHRWGWHLVACILDSYVFWSLRIAITILRIFNTDPQERKHKINCSQQHNIWKSNVNSQKEYALTIRNNYILEKQNISFKYLIIE